MSLKTMTYYFKSLRKPWFYSGLKIHQISGDRNFDRYTYFVLNNICYDIINKCTYIIILLRYILGNFII